MEKNTEFEKLLQTKSNLHRFGYRGVLFEVVFYDRLWEDPYDERTGHYCLYIILPHFQFKNTTHLRMFKCEASKRYHYKTELNEYDPFDACNQSETWHEDEKNQIKIGCDYNHLCHHERPWATTLESVFEDGKRVIDDLHERIGLNVVDQEDGSIVSEEECQRRLEERIAKRAAEKAEKEKETK